MQDHSSRSERETYNGFPEKPHFKKEEHMDTKKTVMLAIIVAALAFIVCPASAADKPNIILILSDDFGYGDSGPYGGGAGRGMPTPSLDRLAAEGMTFFSFYAQPSCTPGRAAVQTGRIPNRSGMTTVAFQGQGGGLAGAEWTLASVLKTGGLPDLLHRQVAPGRSRLCDAQRPGLRRDESTSASITSTPTPTPTRPGSRTWTRRLRAMFAKVTKGAMSGKAGEKPVEEFKINGQYVNTPVIDGKEGVVGIPFIDEYIEKAAIEYLEQGFQVRQAVLLESQLHEGAPAEHAAPGL